MTNRRTMVGFLAKLGVFLALVAATDHLIARALDWGRPEDNRLFVEARQSYGDGGGYDILILGSSHAADALVPEVLEHGLGLQAFNFAVNLSTPVEWYFLVRDLLGRDHSPRLAIIGTDPGIFSRSIAPSAMTPDLIVNPWIRLQLLSESFGDNNLAVAFASGRKRYLLQGVFKRLTGEALAPPRRRVVGIDNGYLRNTRNNDKDAGGGEDDVDLVARIFAHRSSLYQRDYLEATVATLQAAGVDVVIVEPPIMLNRYDALAGSPMFLQFEAWIAEIAQTSEVPVLHGYDRTYLATYAIDDFLNETHVCFTGAWRFTRDVAAWLAVERPNLSYRPVDPTPPLTCRP